MGWQYFGAASSPATKLNVLLRQLSQAQLQVNVPSVFIRICAFCPTAVEATPRHTIPTGAFAIPAATSVMSAPPIQPNGGTGAPVIPLVPTLITCVVLVTWPTEHSLASPTNSPTLAPAAARSRTVKNWGMATAERTPIIATTIINSIKVKPWASPLRPFLAMRLLISSFCCIRRVVLVMSPWVG